MFFFQTCRMTSKKARINFFTQQFSANRKLGVGWPWIWGMLADNKSWNKIQELTILLYLINQLILRMRY